MPVEFEILPYKKLSLAGYHVIAKWAGGSWKDTDDYASDAPQFQTEAEARAWVEAEGLAWLSTLEGHVDHATVRE